MGPRADALGHVGVAPRARAGLPQAALLSEVDLSSTHARPGTGAIPAARGRAAAPSLRETVPRGRVDVLIGLLAAAVYVALGIARVDISVGAAEASPEPTSTCPAGPFDYQDPSAITVNVFNSTTIDGLATTAADQLRGRAFAVRDIGNRQVGSTGMTAIIVSGEGGRANAFTVQRTIPDSLYVADDREDRTVDVIVGSSYTGIVPPEGVDITPAALRCAGGDETPAPTPAAP